jgi:hypothetical protein
MKKSLVIEKASVLLQADTVQESFNNGFYFTANVLLLKFYLNSYTDMNFVPEKWKLLIKHVKSFPYVQKVTFHGILGIVKYQCDHFIFYFHKYTTHSIKF